jgi:hypothetical protein
MHESDKDQEAESEDEEGYQRDESGIAGRFKSKRINNAEADDRENICNILRMLLIENRG